MMEGYLTDGKCYFKYTVVLYIQILCPLMNEFFLFQDNIDDHINDVIRNNHLALYDRG